MIPVLQPGAPASEPPPFERIAIVGLGLIGGSLALAIRRRWRGGLVIGVDRKDVLETCMRMHAVDVGADDLGMAAEADLIVLAAPVRRNIAILQELPALVAQPALVTDVGSTKTEMLREASALPGRLTFIGGHPLAGAAAGGIRHARPDLFDGRPWLLTTPAPEPHASRLESLLRGVGAAPMRMDPAEHDRLLAFISHLPQLAVSALMHVVGEGAGTRGLALAGQGLRDTARLASSPPQIWKEIAATNTPALRDALDALLDALQKLRNDLSGGDALQAIFESAARWKAILDDSPLEKGNEHDIVKES